MARAQLSTTMLEVAVGVVLILTVALGFGLDVPGPDESRAQLDRYAEDTAVLLTVEAPRHGDATRLSEVLASRERFRRERDALRHRVDRILPANVFFRVETPRGDVGYETPVGVTTGTARVTTTQGTVTIRVWYG